MLTEELYQQLNKQMMLEFEASNLYKSMSAWCNSKGYIGASRFLNEHSREEMQHMEKLFTYINETGFQAIITDLKAPQYEFSSLKEVFELIYKHEQFITKKIFELADFSLESKDFSTFAFLQWYTAEQHQEESLFQGIIEKFDIIGTEGRGLFMIDKEIGNLTQH
ncbi:MAG: ferritin [Sulfurovum sp.]